MQINAEQAPSRIGVLGASFLKLAEVSDGPNGQKHTVAVADTDGHVLRVVEVQPDEVPTLLNLKPGDPVVVFVDFTASRAGKPVGIRPISQGEIK